MALHPGCSEAVSAARQAYERDHAEAPGVSFTAYLTWTLFQTLRGHPAFNLRLVEGSWYLLRKPPLGRCRLCRLDACSLRSRSGAKLISWSQMTGLDHHNSHPLHACAPSH